MVLPGRHFFLRSKNSGRHWHFPVVMEHSVFSMH